jgi:hypothetical protein
MTGGVMKKSELFHFTATAIALVIGITGFSSCASLPASSGTASGMREKSSQKVLYQQSGEQEKAIQPGNETVVDSPQTDETASLGGASDPNWGPLPLNIRW